MVVKELDGKIFQQMVVQAANHLSQNKEKINALNVFPVPDGDTGTNMHLTLSSGVDEVKKSKTTDVGQVALLFSKGLLMGARGNSGVILSQLFRGFAKGIENKKTLTSKTFATAFQKGVETAYKSVMKPVEGTILTVAKDAAKKAKISAGKNNNITKVMEDVLQEAKASLKQTPNQLSVLKEVGVVDSGGQGLVIIYEAFLSVLEGKKLAEVETEEPSIEEMVRAEHHKSVQSFMKTEDIEYGYCTEFIVKMDRNKLGTSPFHEDHFRETIGEQGDSLLVVADEEYIKVHIHSEYPGKVLTYAQRFGDLINIKIENMREQHSDIIRHEKSENIQANKTDYGFVTVAAGDGLVKLFKSLGVNEVIHGGQTMNPCTENIVAAIEKVNAETVFVLPNNSNIIMAAKQAASVTEKNIIVIPSKTVPQGMAALFAFNPTKDVHENEEGMTAALHRVKSGQVTFAVRDTVIDGVNIKKGDWLSISEGKIIATAKSSQLAAEHLLKHMITEENELVSIICGEDTSQSESEQLRQFIESKVPDIEVEIHQGLQPIYSYIISVE